MAQNSSSKALSLLDAKKGCLPNLGEIVPANRSSLASENCKIVGCKNSRDICSEVLQGRKMPSRDQKVIDLADGSQLDKKVKAPSAKKRRFIRGEYDLMQHIESSHEHTRGNKIFLFKSDRYCSSCQ